MSPRPPLHVVLAAPRGFCAGVSRAIAAVSDALERYGPPVYVRHAIVHNQAVVDGLRAQGAVFVEDLDDVPDGGVVIFSAHGVPNWVIEQAEQRGLRYRDATCPLVSKVHREVRRHVASGRHVILVGHGGHPEIVGTTGQVPREAVTVVASVEAVMALPFAADTPLAYATQTTFALDALSAITAALEARYSDIVGPHGQDICYATTNRQSAVKAIAPAVGAFIIAGDQASSNATRLVEVARRAGCERVQLVPSAADIDWPLLAGIALLGLSAAASTPELTVQAILAALAERFDLQVREDEPIAEQTTFRPVVI